MSDILCQSIICIFGRSASIGRVIGGAILGHKTSVGERMQADLAVMQSLPATPFGACDLRSGQVPSTSVVRYRGNDSSVPVAFGHRDIWIKGFVDRVVIGCAADGSHQL